MLRLVLLGPIIDLTVSTLHPKYSRRLINEFRVDLTAWSLCPTNVNGKSLLLSEQ